jgi:hypothetical protein
MNATQGYYSLIQYCPDATRLEAATIGVLLFCPERGFLKAITARSNQRIRRFFGAEEHDWQRINSYKLAIEERLEVEQPGIQSLEDLEQFIALRANRLQITAPRSVAVEDPEENLKALFEEIVGGEPTKEGRVDLCRHVGEWFRRAGVERKLATDVDVVVPVFNHRIHIPYGFQNGRFNLIQPVRFQAAQPEHAVNTACRYAVEGRSLYENADPRLGLLKLVVVGKFRDEDAQTKSAVKRVLSNSYVDLFPLDELDRLIDEIRETGKDLSVGEPQ